MRTERVKMLAGELYDPMDPDLVAGRERARDLCQALNATREAEQEQRRRIATDLFWSGGDTVLVQPRSTDHGRSRMKPRITVITLGVDDLERSLRFYRDGLGFPTEGVIGTEFEHGAVVFIDLQAGLKLALWPRASMAHDTGLPVAPPSATEFTLGHNVPSRAHVDAAMHQARAAGARIVKEAQDTLWGGYAGYFQDPDGHLWEVVWNPSFAVPE